MQKLNYPLKTYIKAVEIIAKQKGFREIKVCSKKGSAVRFDTFVNSEEDVHSAWTVHSKHNKKRTIYSKEDYRKVPRHLNCTLEEFIEILEQC